MDIWFVLYCKAHKDEIAENGLCQQGYVVYRPCITIAKKNKNGTPYTRRESLFPRYLFLNVDPKKVALAPVTYTRGIIGFVKFGGEYFVIDEDIIGSIKRCESSQQNSSRKECALNKGERVYLNGEGFNDIEATFFEKCSDNRVFVLLKILGRLSKVLVPSDYISKNSVY